MEAIEESQVSDRSIMEATVIERQDHSGRIRFKTQLPSGRDLNSEWIQESDKTKAGLLWAEAVRGQIVQDSQEAAALARKQLREIKTAAPSVQIVDASGKCLPSAVLPIQTTENIVRPDASAQDPSAYVRSQYEAAIARRNELVKQSIALDNELAAVTRQKIQWQSILQTMGISVEQGMDGHTNDRVDGGSAIGSGGIVSEPYETTDDEE